MGGSEGKGVSSCAAPAWPPWSLLSSSLLLLPPPPPFPPTMHALSAGDGSWTASPMTSTRPLPLRLGAPNRKIPCWHGPPRARARPWVASSCRTATPRASAARARTRTATSWTWWRRAATTGWRRAATTGEARASQHPDPARRRPLPGTGAAGPGRPVPHRRPRGRGWAARHFQKTGTGWPDSCTPGTTSPCFRGGCPKAWSCAGTCACCAPPAERTARCWPGTARFGAPVCVWG